MGFDSQFLLRTKTLPLLLSAVYALHYAIAAPPPSPVERLYVFGDSYSDTGAGYLDGNGPTAVAYLAERLGFRLFNFNGPWSLG